MTATTPQPAEGEPDAEAKVEAVAHPAAPSDPPAAVNPGQPQQAALLSPQVSAGHPQPAPGADVMGMLQQGIALQQSNALAALFHQNLNSLATLQQVQPQQQQQQFAAQQAQQLQQLSQHQANLAQQNQFSQLQLQLLLQASQQPQLIPGQPQQQQQILQQQPMLAGGLQGLDTQPQNNMLQAAFARQFSSQGLAQELLVQPAPPGEPEPPQEKEPS